MRRGLTGLLVLLALPLAEARAGERVVVQRRTAAPERAAAVDGATEIREHPPGLVGPGEVELCNGPPLEPGALPELSLGVEGELNYLSWEAAWRRARGALRRLACLSGPTRPEELGRLYWLAGVAAWQARQPIQAEELFARALEADEMLAWDPMHGEEGRSTFDAMREADPERVVLEWTAPEWDSVWIDGSPATSGQLVTAGWHLLQLEGESGQVSLMVQVPQPGTRVVVPAAFPDDWSLRMGEPEMRTNADQLLVLVYPEGDTVWLPGRRGSTWRTVVGTRSWAQARRTSPAVRWGVMGVGGALAVAGGVGAAISAEQASLANLQMDTAETNTAWQGATERHLQATQLNAVSWMTIGVGAAAVAIAALPLPVWSDAQLTPWVAPGGGGLMLGGRW